MLDHLNKHSDPNKKKTVVIDAGIDKQENLELINSKGYDCIWVSNRRLKNFSIGTSKITKRQTNRDKHELELSVLQKESIIKYNFYLTLTR